MSDLFVLALLGHLLGDYIFQSKSMALKKSQKGLIGFAWCSTHVAIYSLCVALMWGNWSLLVFAAVYVPHWVIDRWSLASWWLKLIRGRTFEAAFNSKDKYREFDVAFSCLVYAVVDNTFHLLSLFGVIEYLLLKGK